MSTGRERRKSARLPIPLEVELRVGDTAFNTGQTRDLSPRGIYLLTEQQPPLGKECRLLFRVGGPRGQLRFEVNGRIARVDAGGTGVVFADMPLDSYYVLRNLVQCCMEDLGQEIERVATRPAAPFG